MAKHYYIYIVLHLGHFLTNHSCIPVMHFYTRKLLQISVAGENILSLCLGKSLNIEWRVSNSAQMTSSLAILVLPILHLWSNR